jgi:hypothetical protein
VALAPRPGGGVAGRVLLAAGGSPVADAVVAGDGTPLADTTDGMGAFLVSHFPAGPQRLRVDEFLFMPESLTAAVPIGGNDTLVFRLEPVSLAYNFEDTSAAGWAVNVDGSDSAGVVGQWKRIDPSGAYGGDAEPVQPEDDHTRNPRAFCWNTGPPGARPPENDDVDGGKTTLYSPVIDMSAIASPVVSYWRWFSNNSGENPGEDPWVAQISSDGGIVWVTVDSTTTTANRWTEVRFPVGAYVTPTTTVRMRFIAEDRAGDSIVKAALDDFRVWGPSAIVGVPGPGAPGSPPGGIAGSAFRFALAPCAPNPARAGSPGATALSFSLAAAGPANIEVYSVGGRRVATITSGWHAAGPHTALWDGRDASGRSLPSGVYLVRLASGSRAATRKLVLID